MNNSIANNPVAFWGIIGGVILLSFIVWSALHQGTPFVSQTISQQMNNQQMMGPNNNMSDRPRSGEQQPGSGQNGMLSGDNNLLSSGTSDLPPRTGNTMQ